MNPEISIQMPTTTATTTDLMSMMNVTTAKIIYFPTTLSVPSLFRSTHYHPTTEPTQNVSSASQIAHITSSSTEPAVHQSMNTTSLLRWTVSDVLSVTSTSSANATTTTTLNGPITSPLATLTWPQTCLLAFFSTVIIITVLGNTLILLSVITTRRLRTVTNCFVLSLAVADWMVGIFVMPPNVLLYVYDDDEAQSIEFIKSSITKFRLRIGRWSMGWILCDIWVSLDILLCTASILSLCAISLDRYLAVTQPLHYKKRRTKRLAMLMILIVWILALLITCPPILGWYEAGRSECRYNQNKGYVVYSAMGSFFIPMAVMLYVYARICCVLTSRRSRITRTEVSERTTIHDDIDFDANTSDYDSAHHHSPKRKYSMRTQQQIFSQKSVERAESHHESLYELVEISKSTSTIRTSSTITNYKFSTIQQFKPIHYCASQTSLPETYLHGHHHTPHSHLHPMHKANRMHRQQNIAAAAASLGSYGKRVPMRISSSKRESKAAKTLSMVVGGFIACWMPFFVYYLLIPFLPRDSVSETAMNVLTWLGWVNSAINPFIYAFYNSDFRIAFWRLTFRKLCKSQTNQMMLKT